MQWPDSVNLARLAAQGDRQALDDLWRRDRHWVAAIVLAHKPPEVELEDAVQEVAMSVHQSITSLRDPHRFRAWLRSIALNCTTNQWRRDRSSRQVSLNGLARESPNAANYRAPLSRNPDDHDQMRRVESLILQLPLMYRECLLLSGVHGLTAPQIANTLQISVKTVETRIRRARHMVRQELTCQQSRDVESSSPENDTCLQARRIHDATE